MDHGNSSSEGEVRMRKYATRLNALGIVFFSGLLFVCRRWGQIGLNDTILAMSSEDNKAKPHLRADIPVHIIQGMISRPDSGPIPTLPAHKDNDTEVEGLTDSVSGYVCRKVNHFAMIKTEKTGSSTLFSILARYILNNRLNVMVMTKGGHIDVTASRGQSPGWDIGPNATNKADALIHHARYNSSLLDTVMHPDTKYITLVRDAASWYQSAIRFWPGQVKFQSPDETLNRTDLFYQPRSMLKDDYNGQKTLFHIPQLQWLGFDYSQSHNISAIKRYIHHIVPKFHCTFLTDQFDASLILMKREFCWHHSDIFYKPQEVGGRKQDKSSKSLLPLTAQGKIRLLTLVYNLGDELLYEAFNQSWWSQEEINSSDLWQEVEQFRKSNEIVIRKCLLKGLADVIIPVNKWSREIRLNKKDCMNILYENDRLIKDLARYAIGKKYDHIHIVR